MKNSEGLVKDSETIKSCFIGVDPGLNGAIAVIDDEMNLLEIWEMPTEARSNKRAVSPLDLSYNIRALQNDYKVQNVLIERVHSMPKQGVASSFTFGESFGVVRGVFTAFGFRVMLTPPVEWKKHFQLNGKPKDESRRMAMQWFPDRGDWFSRKKDTDRADAALLALCARNSYNVMNSSNSTYCA